MFQDAVNDSERGTQQPREGDNEEGELIPFGYDGHGSPQQKKVY